MGQTVLLTGSSDDTEYIHMGTKTLDTAASYVAVLHWHARAMTWRGAAPIA